MKLLFEIPNLICDLQLSTQFRQRPLGDKKEPNRFLIRIPFIAFCDV